MIKVDGGAGHRMPTSALHLLLGHWCLVICWSLGLGHWCFPRWGLVIAASPVRPRPGYNRPQECPAMLDFPCPKCGRPFSLPDDEAGREIQCTNCGILVRVPLASDLASLNPDGTLKLADP